MRPVRTWMVILALLPCLASTAAAVLPAGVQLERVLTVKDGLSHNSVLAVAVGPEHVYVGTKRYMTVLKRDGGVTVWSPKNSGLKFHQVPAVILRGTQLWTTCRSPVAGGGTYRWDGLQWEWFEEIKDDMQSNYISCFHVDDKNMLWIGTEDQGINYYVHETNPYRKFGYLASKKGLLDNRVTCLSSRPGELWIGTLSGISVYRGQEGEKYLFTNHSKATGLPADHIVALAVTPERAFAGTTMGLLIFEGGAWRLLGKESGLADPWITALALDGPDLWIGSKKGLQLMRGGRIEPPIDYRDGLPTAAIHCLTVVRQADGVNRLFVGTDKGLAILRRP